jgi:hypothetical protein
LFASTFAGKLPWIFHKCSISPPGIESTVIRWQFSHLQFCTMRLLVTRGGHPHCGSASLPAGRGEKSYTPNDYLNSGVVPLQAAFRPYPVEERLMPSVVPLSSAVVGDEVAVLPEVHSPPSEVLDIQTLSDVGPVIVKTVNNLIFAKASGVALNDGNHHAVMATDEHRQKMKAAREHWLRIAKTTDSPLI